MTRRTPGLALAALLLATGCASTKPATTAANPAPAPAAPVEKTLTVTQLTPHAYLLAGRGGNIALFIGEKEVVLVDSQFEQTAPELLETLRGLTDKPIAFLVNTHHHPDHVSGNAALAPHVTRGIIAHTNVAKRMTAAQEKLDPAKRGGVPTMLVGADDPAVLGRHDLHLPGLELHIIHRQAAHTDGDCAVGFPDELVLHMGDVYFNGMLPFIDVKDGGGSFDGLVDHISWFTTWMPDGIKIVPGHGPVATKQDLLHYRDFLVALQKHAKANPQKSSKELADSFLQAAFPEWKPIPTFVTWETLFDAVTGRGPGRVPRP